MISLIDTHIHFDAPELNGQGLNFLPDARQCGIDRFVVPGVRLSGWSGMVSLVAAHDEIFLAPGLHPAYADQWNGAAASQLEALTRQPKVVAIGEIGLDGFVDTPWPQQEAAFRSQLQIALAAGLPVLLHGRKTTGALLKILRELQVGEKVGGIWHGFSGSLSVAQELVDLGFKIGIGPVLLKNNAKKLPAVVETLPLSTLVLETDFPDMADNPGMLVQVAEKIAEIKGTSLADVGRVTTENARRLFSL